MSNQQLPGTKLKKPKRPMTAYNFFFKSEHQKICQESEGYEAEDGRGEKKEDARSIAGGGVDTAPADDSMAPSTKKRKSSRVGFEDLGKVIGKRWKEIEKKELERYQELARKDSERYKRESEKYYEDHISALCMGYNKRSDDEVDPVLFHTGLAQTPLTLAQEANLILKTVNPSGGCAVPTEQEGQKSKKKTAAKESLHVAASSATTGSAVHVAAGNGAYGTGVIAGFNPSMMQTNAMNAVSSSQLQQQWMQQQAMMMTMMMANPAFQVQFAAVQSNMMNRSTAAGAASDSGASIAPDSRPSVGGIMGDATDGIGNGSVPRTGTTSSNAVTCTNSNGDEVGDGTNVNVGAATKGFI